MSRSVAVAVRHVAFEDLGILQTVLTDRGYAVRYLEAGVDDLAAPLASADLAVVLGGPIGVYETTRYPFLITELQALERRLAAGRPTLGICLGAQLIAAALGARVHAGVGKEIGWAPVQLTEAGLASPLASLNGRPVLHWHGDTFELPAGTRLLASTPEYPHQAFSAGPRTLALQFHAEVDADRIETWLIGHACELAQAGLEPAPLRKASRVHAGPLREAGTRLFQDWLDGL